MTLYRPSSFAGRDHAAALQLIAEHPLPVARLDAKFKMKQNRPANDRTGVIAALDASSAAADRAVADWTRSHD